MKKFSSMKELIDADVYVIMQDNDGKELARFKACEFTIKKAIPVFYDYLLAEYGQVLPLSDITKVTADTFDVSTSYVRDVIREHHKNRTNQTSKGAPNNGRAQGNQR